jgi:hypothetical protein
MPMPVNELEAQALSLSAADRAHLLRLLIDSFDSDAKLDEEWADGAWRRETEAHAGKRSLVSGAKGLALIRANLP